MQESTRRLGLTLVAFGSSLIACGVDSPAAPSETPAETANEARTAERKPYHANIVDLARANTMYRRVVFTGARSQLVVMSLLPGEDIGLETHAHVEQILVVVSGAGRVELGGATSTVRAGDVLVVTPGTAHDLTNTGKEPLKLYTVYTPPNHIDGRQHATKQDAERDTEDEDFGRRVE